MDRNIFFSHLCPKNTVYHKNNNFIPQIFFSPKIEKFGTRITGSKKDFWLNFLGKGKILISDSERKNRVGKKPYSVTTLRHEKP